MRTFPLQEYFYYTRLERNAGIVLCVLCTIAYSLPLFYNQLSPPPGKLDFSEVRQLAAAFAPAGKPNENESKFVAFRGRENESPRQAVESFPFDPNTATKDELMRLGLSARTAQTVLNFRAKGGHFYKKEDLQKVYGLREEDYHRLAGLVQLSDAGRDFEKYPKRSDNQGFVERVDYRSSPSANSDFPKKNTSVVVDINTASSEDWQQIKGVGPGYAKRIVNFREKLGGFSSVAQVGETLGLPDSVFQKMLPQLQAASPVFRQININSATLDELKVHPYLSSYQATILFNYRLQHGSYADFASLKKVKGGFKEEDWRRLEPYITFN